MKVIQLTAEQKTEHASRKATADEAAKAADVAHKAVQDHLRSVAGLDANAKEPRGFLLLQTHVSEDGNYLIVG